MDIQMTKSRNILSKDLFDKETGNPYFKEYHPISGESLFTQIKKLIAETEATYFSQNANTSGFTDDVNELILPTHTDEEKERI
jgi:hypothetical protein